MLVVKETLFYLVLFAVSINAATKERFFFGGQNWYNFRMGFTPNPFDGFIGQPRTTAEAIDAGWQQISNDCSEGARFLFIFRPRSDQVWSSRLTRGGNTFFSSIYNYDYQISVFLVIDMHLRIPRRDQIWY